MKIVYKFYESNQGLEEIQTSIYNQNTGFDAPVEAIKERIRNEKTDPKQLRYAFSEEGQPLAYIQARAGKNGLFSLGYPWAAPNCPIDVQEKLFDEMFSFIKQKNPTMIRFWLHDDWKKQIEFFRKKGFEISGRDGPGIYMTFFCK